MKAPAMSFLKAKLEYVVAALALSVVAVVVPWWAVLAQRLVTQNIALKTQIEMLTSSTPVDLSAEAERLHFMLTTEFAAMAAALATAIAVLVYIARGSAAARALRQWESSIRAK